MSDNVTPIRDPFDVLWGVFEQFNRAINDTFEDEDDYHPLPESDEAVLRAAALLRQAVENLRAATAIEQPRYRAWDEAQCRAPAS